MDVTRVQMWVPGSSGFGGGGRSRHQSVRDDRTGGWAKAEDRGCETTMGPEDPLSGDRSLGLGRH